MGKKNAKFLLEKYNAGLCNEEEKAIVESWYLTLPDEGTAPEYGHIERTKKEVWKLLSVRLNQSRRLNFTTYISTAAILIICLGIGIYFSSSFKKTAGAKVNYVRHDIAPGGNKAILVLANGKRITIDDKSKGEIAKQAGVTITKTANGQLVYKVIEVKSADPNVYNSIITPKGGQYQISLPDGTQVSLNAASSLKFPAAFTGKERRVELDGEAYFEVTKNPHLPFKVITAQQEVQVFGTHFNINSYGNEFKTRTSLFEGSVKVSSRLSHFSAVLKPGQQSIIDHNGLEVKRVDADDALAWKNGLFVFNNEELESIMRKVSRWYNVDIIYKNDEVRKDLFGGSISRFGNVSEVLRMLEITGNVHFKIEENKIIVMKK